jgi:hypothetical protein
MSKYYFVGSGIASLAGAAYLIRDGNFNGAYIILFEESNQLGGALDAHGTATGGYFMSGSRMFEHKYNATFDLFSFIPSASDPSLSVKEETALAEKDALWHNKARLVNGERKIVDSHELGFSRKDRIDLVELIAGSEKSLNSKRITDCFEADFFNTNFWFEWCSLFAFERWHSAMEFRRYLRRFMHHFSTIDTQEGIFRTRYNQYDSMAVPLVNWLRVRGVTFRLGTQVTNLGFKAAGSAITVKSLQYINAGTQGEIPIEDGDLVFVTNGSMTADKTFGSMTEAPVMEAGRRSGAWRLWETIAAGRPEFGNPAAFDSHIDARPGFLSTDARVQRQRSGQGRPAHAQGLELAADPVDLSSALLSGPAGGRLRVVGLRPVPRQGGKLREEGHGGVFRKRDSRRGHWAHGIRGAPGEDPRLGQRDSLHDALHHQPVSGEEERRPARCGSQGIDQPGFPGPVFGVAGRRGVHRGILGALGTDRRQHPAETEEEAFPALQGPIRSARVVRRA